MHCQPYGPVASERSSFFMNWFFPYYLPCNAVMLSPNNSFCALLWELTFLRTAYHIALLHYNKTISLKLDFMLVFSIFYRLKIIDPYNNHRCLAVVIIVISIVIIIVIIPIIIIIIIVVIIPIIIVVIISIVIVRKVVVPILFRI